MAIPAQAVIVPMFCVISKAGLYDNLIGIILPTAAFCLPVCTLILTGTMRDIAAQGTDVLTIGQYLRPSPMHLPIERYWTPDEFRTLRDEGMTMGYRHVESGPLVRSSYHAERHVGV